MEEKCAGSDVKQAVSSATVDKKEDPFAKRGIFSNGDDFLCLICDKICTLSMVPEHMTGERHCTKLEMANCRYAKFDARFACTICLTYVAADWKSFLNHLNEKDHFEELENRIIAATSKDTQTPDTLFSYISLLENQIIENDSGTFFCYRCEEVVVAEKKILQHIGEKRHQNFQQTCHTKKYTANCNENKSRHLVKHGIVHTSVTMFKCILCNLSMAGVKSCEGHIRGYEHVQNVIKRENIGNLFVLEKMIEIISQSPQISRQNPQTIPQSSQTSSQSPSPKSPQNASPKFFDKLTRDNSITGPLSTDRYYCRLCKTSVYGYTNVFEHVYGDQHTKSMEAVGNGLKLATESDKTSEGSSISWISTENSSESWQTYECESGSSYENSSCCWESSDNVTDSWETISIQGSSSESQGSMPFEIPEHLIPLISTHHLQCRNKEIFCPLCEAHLQSPQSLLDHTRSKYHVAELNRYKDRIEKENKKESVTRYQDSSIQGSSSESQGSMPFEIPEHLIPLISTHHLQCRNKEIFCPLCEAHLQSPQSLLDHTRSKYHVAELNRYKDRIEKENKKESVTRYQDSSIQGSSSESQGSMPFEIPEHLIPLISTHHLQCRNKEIFCPLCEAHLQSPQSLLDHTRSKYHVAELNRYKDRIEKENKKESVTRYQDSSIQGSSSESQGSMPFEIPEHLIPSISKHHLQYRKQEIFCPLCNVRLQSLQSLLAHTRSKYHVAELNRYKDRIEKENITESVTSGKSSAASSPLNAMNKKPDPKHETGTTTQANRAEKSGGRQSILFDIPKSLTPLISKHMLEYRETEIFCVACEAHLKNLDSLLAHTRSKYHSATLDSYKSKIAKQHKVLTDTSGRNSTSSSVSSTVSKKILSMTFTNKHKAGVTITKNLTIEVQPPPSELFKIPDHLIPLLASHSLQRFESEIFCPACQVHLRHVNNMIQHTNSQNHMAKLRKDRAEISRKSESSAKISKMNAGVNSSIKSANEKPSNVKPQSNTTTLKIDTANPQKSGSSLMRIPKNLLPLIQQHSLKHLKNEIYCEACTVLMKDATSLVSHTSSRRHVAILESFRATNSAKKTNTETLETKLEPPVRKLTSRSENTTGLENSLRKLTIEDEKQENSDKLSQNELKNIINQPPRKMKSRKQDNRVKQNRAFDPKYLKVDMQHFYEVNPEKLRKMTLSCQLCFPKTSRTVYCLICEKSVGSKLQTFYEHICSSAHTVYLAEAEKNDEHFINYPDQFSDLALTKEYMQEGQEETIQCLACDKFVKNDDIVILEHIKADSHNERKQLWKKSMENILQEILLEMAATWYNIQKYWCQPCDIQYNTEFHFAEHMDSKKHKNSLKKLGGFQGRLVYDSCIPCATLWLGVSGVFPEHCEQPMHKYLVQTGDFSVCKLPNQAMNLLKNSEAEVASLIELSDQVLTVQKVKVDSLLKCLEDTVKSCYPNAKAHPLGSRVSGLGFPGSDIDVFLDCGTYDGTNNSKEYQDELIITVEHCLYAEQKLWEIEETLVTTRTPIIKIRHRETELRCDVSFKNGLSVENTKLLKCYIDNYPPCRMLMLFLKKWLSLCNLSGSYYITNYATCWYVIFYLQRKAILPSIASLIAKENKSNIIDGWETGISETFDVDEQEFEFTELLHDFFVFYNDFDYRDSVACPLLGRSLLKQDFTELDRLPKEMAPYINHVKNKSVDGLVELFRIDSEMCIQDPYDLSHNLTKAVRKHTLNRFKRLCAESAKILNDFIQH